MNLSPREKDKLLISMVAIVARRRLDRGVKLNHPEAIAIISDFILEGARDDRRRIAGIFDPLGPFDIGAQSRELVRHLVQMAAALAEELRRYLAGDAEHRFVAAERGEQRRAGIEHAGAGHDTEHAGPAAGTRIAECHVAAGLLVPRADHLELGLVESVEQAVDLRAGQAEYGVDAVSNKPAYDRFAAGEGGHCIIPLRWLVRLRRRHRCARVRCPRPRPRRRRRASGSAADRTGHPRRSACP